MDEIQRLQDGPAKWVLVDTETGALWTPDGRSFRRTEEAAAHRLELALQERRERRQREREGCHG